MFVLCQVFLVCLILYYSNVEDTEFHKLMATTLISMNSNNIVLVVLVLRYSAKSKVSGLSCRN